jgi:hypothetical protein
MSGPSATVTKANVLAGPGALYWGLQAATNPADTAVNVTPQASAGWTDAGATDGGLTVTWNQSFFEKRVDQVADVVGRVLTERDVQIQTNLAEGTLENLALALNNTTASSGSGYKKLALIPGQAAMIITPIKVIVDGWAPGTNKRRRFLARSVTSIGNVESSYKKDGMFFVPVTFSAEYVDPTTSPVDTIDETA